jgi:NlpC/P60 family putative phage cell wall peptidase
VSGERVAVEARSWLGTPYLHQASLKGAGADCLGLVRGIWRSLHGAEPAPIPAYTRDWAEPSQDEVLWRAARRWLQESARDQEDIGDVLLFRMAQKSVAKHLGIQVRLGDTAAFVHAYSGHGVVETALSKPWRLRVVARFSFP